MEKKEGEDKMTKTSLPGVDESGEFVLANEIVRALSAGGLDKYTEVFTQEEIDLESFLMLNDTDLRNMNIPTGPRKKILKKIQHLRDKHPNLLSSSPGSPAGGFYLRSPPSSQPSSLSSSCSPPSPAFSSTSSARSSPASSSSPSPSAALATAVATTTTTTTTTTGSLSIPASTPPPSPIVSPLLHFPAPSHYSAINDDDLQKGRSLSVDNLGRQEIEPRAAHRRDHAGGGGHPIKRFMSDSPTTTRLLGSAHHGAMPATTPPQPRRAPSPGQIASSATAVGSTGQQRKLSLPPPNHATAPYDRPENDAIDPTSAGSAYAGLGSARNSPGGGRQRAFALSYLPKDSTSEFNSAESKKSENESAAKQQLNTTTTTTTPTPALASTASYSAVEGGKAKQQGEPVVELRLSSSQPNRSFMPRDRIESRILRAKWEIEFDELVLEEKIGSGNFGIVWRAKWRNSPCVVKRLKDKAIQEKLLQEFREESRVWMNIRPHANVVQFLGASSKVPNICIVTEYLPLGDARQLVKSQSIPLKSKLNLLLGIAAGVCHLHREGVVHRDLACRNVMVTKNVNGEYDAKVGDFGLSRLGQEGIYASSTGEGPLKWMPPEAINPHQRIFSLKSDSWSFGVVVWEILMDGAEPFGNDDAVTAGLRILKGDRLQLPAHTPAPLAALVRDCWRESDELRPDFDVICRRMQDICNSYVADAQQPSPPPQVEAVPKPELGPKPFGKTLAQLEGSNNGARRANEMVELMIKKGIITDSPEKKQQPAWSGGMYDKIGTTAAVDCGGSYGRISESVGGNNGSYGSISANNPAASTAHPPSGLRDPRRASFNLGAGRASHQVPAAAAVGNTTLGADVSDDGGGSDSAALKRSDPTSPVRQRPRSVALSADCLPGNNPDWRYQAQQGGVQLSGRMSLRLNKQPVIAQSDGPASQPSVNCGEADKPPTARKAWFAVESGKSRGDRESTGITLGMLGQRRSSLSPSSSSYDGAFALLCEREVYLIIHYLDAASLRNLSMTSRQWRQLYGSPALWRFLFKKRQRATGVDGLVLRRRRRSTLTKNESGEIETRRRRQSYEASASHGVRDTELFAHFVTKLATRSLQWPQQQADDGAAAQSTPLASGFSWHRLYVAYFEPWKLPSTTGALLGLGDPITPRGSSGSGGSGSGRSSREPSMREPSVPCITIGQRTADPLPFKIGMYGMDGVEITSLVTSFVEQSLPRSRSGSGSPRRMYVGGAASSFSMAKLLSETVLLSSAQAALGPVTTVGLTQTHAVQTLGDVNPRAANQSQQGSYRVESEVDGLRSFFDVNLATYAKDNSRFQKLADRELFCLCYDPHDLHSFFFAISLFYELFDDDFDADGGLRIPPLFLVARSTITTPTAPTASSDCTTVTVREGKMLASILCCPFYALAAPAHGMTDAESLRLLFHSMAREVRLTREGYATRFRKSASPGASSSLSSSTAQLMASGNHYGSLLRESQSGRVMVVKDDLYIGQVSEKTQERCGVGIAWMKASRELYMGEWRDDMPHGWGVLYSPRDGRRVWAGSWMAGRALSSAVDLALDVAPSSPSNNPRRSK